MNLRILTALLAISLVLPALAAAQRGVDVRVTPQFGLVTPVDWFYYEVTVLGEGPMEWTEAAVLEAYLVGVTAEVEVAGSGVWLRGNVLRTTNGETYLAHAVLNKGVFTPPTVARTLYRIPSAITFGSIDLALPTRLRLPLGIQPYFTAGVGGKHYSFDRGPIDAADRLVAPEDGTSLMANLGGGFVVRIVGVDLDVQVRDTISRYWGTQQHDVTWVAGLAWRIF